MDRARLTTRLKVKEGLRLKVYKDSLNFWTICYGHLLAAPMPAVATCEQCNKWLQTDIDDAARLAEQYDFYAHLIEPFQNVMVELTFNLGKKLDKFKKFLAAMTRGDYSAAAGQLRNSAAYEQEPKRFDELITSLSTGEFPV